MTVEERVSRLEEKFEKRPFWQRPYAQAMMECEKHFNEAKLQGQFFKGFGACRQATRDAFSERRERLGRRDTNITAMVRTEADAQEFIDLFDRFLGVYQDYLGRRGER